MNPGATGGVPMIPPSTKAAPPASTMPATSRAVAGETAFASTYRPQNPAALTSRATPSAACGGHTDSTTSARPATAATSGTAVRPASPARAAVAWLRPAAAHSTSCPAPARHRPTAVPISPGYNSPTVVLLIPPSHQVPAALAVTYADAAASLRLRAGAPHPPDPVESRVNTRRRALRGAGSAEARL